MSELHVVATIPGKPEAAQALGASLSKLAAATREEEGCLAYDVFESAAVPGTFVTVERWRDQAALDGHMTSPHIAEAFAATEGALVGEVAIHPLTPLS
jgi:quinol monooxygenase YgiN